MVDLILLSGLKRSAILIELGMDEFVGLTLYYYYLNSISHNSLPSNGCDIMEHHEGLSFQVVQQL
jgi:hypothetical protein